MSLQLKWCIFIFVGIKFLIRNSNKQPNVSQVENIMLNSDNVERCIFYRFKICFLGLTIDHSLCRITLSSWWWRVASASIAAKQKYVHSLSSHHAMEQLAPYQLSDVSPTDPEQKQNASISYSKMFTHTHAHTRVHLHRSWNATTFIYTQETLFSSWHILSI